MTEQNELKNLFKLSTILATIIILLFIIYGLKLGIFQNKIVLVNYIKKFGIIGPIFFLCFQIFQVIFPVIPGGASCLAGVLAFGPVRGFIYNYLGLVIGSIIAFNLSRKYGIKIINNFFKEETIEKYLKYIKDNKFNKIFFLGIFLPGLPDDLLCYIAGMSKINFKKFLTIILLGKPLTLLTYSFFLFLF